MKKIKCITLVMMIFSVWFVGQAQTKDSCGCKPNLVKSQITVPKVNTEITVTVYYENEFINNIMYKSWTQVLKDFPSISKDSSTVFIFDWKTIAKHPNWRITQKDSLGNLYLGTWFDLSMDHPVSETKLIKIWTWCGIYTCSPKVRQFDIRVQFGLKD